MTQHHLKDHLVEGFSGIFTRHSRDEIFSASPKSIPEWDSLENIISLTLLQLEFHLDIDLTHLDPLRSFADVLVYVEQRVSVNGPADVV
jgi:acyl carrier protein